MQDYILDKKNIKYQPAGQFEETRFEKIHNVIFNEQLKKETCVLGLATGSSPIKVYEELVRLHNEEGLSFENVVTFNLDEYFPMDKDSIHSYYYFMHEHLFNHIDILPENVHIPDGEVQSDEVYQYCIDYEMQIKSAGGLDFQLLGIGRTGHIGFNEPGHHNGNKHYSNSKKGGAIGMGNK